MLAGRHGGAIVNVGSVDSFLGFPAGSAYVSSKDGQIGLTTSVSAELAPQGSGSTSCVKDSSIRRCITGPAASSATTCATRFSYHVFLQGAQAARRRFAQTIVFLCSDEASYVSGTTLTPGGGFTLTI
jgi:NAD(P)-dependent dehydrogenase (short-subunit alcohol dehydrogenase family)